MSMIVRNNSFSVFEGQITGVFGLIGSGRTETFKVVAGIYKRDFLGGGTSSSTAGRCATSAARGGDGRHRLCHRGPQERRLLRDDVGRREPVFRPARGRPRARLGDQHQEMQALPAEWTGRSDQAINDNARVVELSGGNQQKVVIGKGLVERPRMSSSTSRRAASTSARSSKSTRSSTGWPTTGSRWW